MLFTSSDVSPKCTQGIKLALFIFFSFSTIYSSTDFTSWFVWESIFFRALSGCIVAIILTMYFGFDKLKTKKPIGHLIRAFSASFALETYCFAFSTNAFLFTASRCICANE